MTKTIRFLMLTTEGEHIPKLLKEGPQRPGNCF